MIAFEDPELEWSVEAPNEKGMVSVTVRYPSAWPFVGWAYRKTEEEARAKALERLNYAKDGYGYAC